MRGRLHLPLTLVLSFSLMAPAFAANYYVKPDGNNSLDGRSDTTAWKTIGKVNSHSFSTGDDVYFKCGGSWADTYLIVDWGGTSDNQVVIGAYYMGGGTEIHGVSGSKPIIDGNDLVPPTYSGLVHVTNRQYVHINNIRLTNSEGYGLLFQDSDNCNAYNVDIDNAYRSGIMINRCNSSSGSTAAEGCDVREYAKMFPEGAPNWGAGLVAIGSNNVTFRMNKVHEGYGEGIYFGNLWSGQTGSNVLIEDNIVYDSRAVSIYVHNAGDVTIRRNLAYGTGNQTYNTRFVHGGVYFAGAGIYVTDENWPAGFQVNNVEIYGNLVSFTEGGLFLGNSLAAGASFSNIVVYNNTFVDNYKTITITGPKAHNAYIRNNILWCITGDCGLYHKASVVEGMEWDHNNWSSSVSGSRSGTGDVVGAPVLRKASEWRSVAGGDLSASDFALQSTSPAINAGINLGQAFAQIPDCDRSQWPENIVLVDQDTQGSGWEIGADVHVENQAPTAPTGLKILSPH